MTTDDLKDSGDEEAGDGKDVDSSDADNDAGLCNAKTPVSLLQELYVRRGMTPKYDLVQIEGAVHEPTFKYRVTIGEFVATGCGQSKKKAKHSAAKSILDKLLGAQNAGLTPPGQPVIPDLAQEIFSPYDDGIEGNPVGILQELCMSRRWPPPTYDLSQEDGLPHERSFSIVCVIGTLYRETGAGKSKKIAKRLAANKMIKRLRLIPNEEDDGNQNIDEDDLAQGLVFRLSQFKDNSLKSGNQSQVNKFHRILKNAEGDCIKKLHNLNLSNDETGEDEAAKIVEIKREDDVALDELDDTNPISFLQNIAEEQKFEVTYVDIEETSKKGKKQCMVQLSSVPVAVCFGTGDSVSSAKISAAENALDYLRVMTKK